MWFSSFIVEVSEKQISVHGLFTDDQMSSVKKFAHGYKNNKYGPINVKCSNGCQHDAKKENHSVS